jgi:hypothetical protein
MPWLVRKLGQDRIAEGFGGDSGAVRNEENCALHWGLIALESGFIINGLGRRIGNSFPPYAMRSPTSKQESRTAGVVVRGNLMGGNPAPMADAMNFQHHGAFPCLQLLTRPPWSFPLRI